ncbi:MAG: dihydroorotate dehydrogenase electron transfer subunit [Bacillota bacterium]
MFEIIKNKEVGPDIFHLVLKCDELSEKPKPGQFFNVKVSRKLSTDPLLRRPFSVFDFNEEQNILELVYRKVGRGTEILSKYKEGEKLDVIGPLGNPFSTEKRRGLIHLVGGGMGIVPLHYLARTLDKGEKKVFLGAESSDELEFFTKRFKKMDVEIHRAAMTEKMEIKGSVLVLWMNYLDQEKPLFVYTCGPEKMLSAVEKECLKNSIQGQLSIEKRMGCGIGVCLSCSCETTEGNKRSCVDGPVFTLGEVVLNA